MIRGIEYSYQKFNNYLNSKYLKNNSTNITKFESNLNSTEKKKIVIYFADLYNREYREKWIQAELGNKFNIEFSSKNPDYVFYNVFGCDHLKHKYKDAIKIAHFTENQIVDFDIADYAIGQHHINYLDRYYRRPFFIFMLVHLLNINFV